MKCSTSIYVCVGGMAGGMHKHGEYKEEVKLMLACVQVVCERGEEHRFSLMNTCQ